MGNSDEIARCADAFEDELTVLQVSYSSPLIYLDQSLGADTVVCL
jgi:hypothetical protein